MVWRLSRNSVNGRRMRKSVAHRGEEGTNAVVACLQFVVFYDFLARSVLFALHSLISLWNLFIYILPTCRIHQVCGLRISRRRNRYP